MFSRYAAQLHITNFYVKSQREKTKKYGWASFVRTTTTLSVGDCVRKRLKYLTGMGNINIIHFEMNQSEIFTIDKPDFQVALEGIKEDNEIIAIAIKWDFALFTSTKLIAFACIAETKWTICLELIKSSDIVGLVDISYLELQKELQNRNVNLNHPHPITEEIAGSFLKSIQP